MPERCAVVGLRRVKLAVKSPVRAQTNLVGPWVASSRYRVRGSRSRYHVRIRMVNAWEYIADATDG